MASRKLIKKIDSLLSRERGTVFKDPGGKVNICLIYPNTYHIGMSNLGFQGIYTLLNERNDVLCERAFLPDDEDMEDFLRTGTEIFSMESKRPLNRFDIVAFSVPFENDYPNIVTILNMSHIPVRAGERNESNPLLLFGGVCASFNPEPVADFFDLCFAGEAEEMLPEFIDAFKASRDRKDLLDRTVGMEGLYVPSLYDVRYGDDGTISERRAWGDAPERIKRRLVEDLSAHSFRPSILTPETEFSNMYLLEAMRGCPWSCKFCLTGYIYKPVRRKDPGLLREQIKGIHRETSKVGLISSSLTDYPYAKDVLCIDNVDFSITSLRASPKSAELIRFLERHKSVSIAPEAGTDRLRRAIDKKLSEDDIVETSRLILAEGIENLRLYFMAGLPTEDEEDIAGIVSLVAKIRAAAPKGNIVLTVSTFVPKPFTPFQWHPMEKMAVVRARLKTIKKGLQTTKGVSVFHDVPKYAYMQGLFSRGDRRVSRVLEKMENPGDWPRACREAAIDSDFYLFRQRDFDEILPWDFIVAGVPKKKLWEEYREALRGKSV